MRGAFILFEGLDHCGKTTHSKDCVNWINESLSKENEFLGIKCISYHFIHQYSKICLAERMFFPQRVGPEPAPTIANYLSGKMKLSVEEAHNLFALQRSKLRQAPFHILPTKLNKG
jgi:hypothetical protein